MYDVLRWGVECVDVRPFDLYMEEAESQNYNVELKQIFVHD
jgi:hypothetical protein